MKSTKAKTRRRLLVTIELPLRMALEGRIQTTGWVWPANGRKLGDSVKAAAGWKPRFCLRIAANGAD